MFSSGRDCRIIGRLSRAFVVLVLSVSAARPIAHDRPNFSGVWYQGEGEIYTISHRDPEISIRMVIKDSLGLRVLIVRGTTDGKKYSQTIDGAAGIFIASWSGDTLVWETDRTTIRGMTLQNRRLMRLSNDGNSITAERTRMAPVPIDTWTEHWTKSDATTYLSLDSYKLPVLAVGTQREQALVTGTFHRYQIKMRKDECGRITIQGRGLNADVIISGPDGQPLMTLPGNGNVGATNIYFIAATRESYQIDVLALDPAAEKATYVIGLDKLAPATKEDRLYVLAEDHLLQARRSIADIDESSETVRHLQIALSLFRRLGDHARECQALRLLGDIYVRNRKYSIADQAYGDALTVSRLAGDTNSEAAVLYASGLNEFLRGNFVQATDRYQEASLKYRRLGDRSKLRQVFTSLGSVYASQNKHGAALGSYSEALAIARESGTHFTICNLLKQISGAELALGQRSVALNSLTDALNRYRSSNDLRGQADILNTIGRFIFANQGDSQKALAYYSQALPLVRKTRDRLGEVKILANFGLALAYLGKTDAAKDNLYYALALSREIRSRLWEGIALNNLGLVFEVREDNVKSIEALTEALSCLDDRREWRERYITLKNLSRVYALFGSPDKAIAIWAEEVRKSSLDPDASRSIRAKAAEAEVRQNIGYLLLSHGRIDASLAYIKQALRDAQRSGDRDREKALYAQLQQIYRSILYDAERTFQTLQEELDRARQLTDWEWEATTLKAMGNASLQLKTQREALAYYDSALSIYKTRNDRKGEATILREMASLRTVPGPLYNRKESVQYFEAARAIMHELNEYADEARIVMQLAMVSESNRSRALEDLERAAALVEAVPDRAQKMILIHELGNLYKTLGATSKAISYYQQSVDMPGWDLDLTVAEAQRSIDDGDLDHAREKLDKAVRELESGRPRGYTLVDETWVPSDGGIYALYVDVLMRLAEKTSNSSYQTSALEMLERSRTRGLVTALHRVGVRITRDADQTLADRERGLDALIGSKVEERLRLLTHPHSAEDLGEIDTELARLSGEFRSLHARANWAPLRDSVASRPVTVDEIKTQLLDKDTVLLEYALGDTRSYMWVVTSDVVQGCILPSRKAIVNAVNQLLSTVVTQAGRSQAQYAMQSAALSHMLLSPAASFIEDRRLIIVSGGALQHVPFAALPDPSGGKNSSDPLVLRHQIVNLPSMSVLSAIRRGTSNRANPSKGIAVLADPVFASGDSRFLRDSASLPIDRVIENKAAEFKTKALERAASETFLAVDGIHGFPRVYFSAREASAIQAYMQPEQDLLVTGFRANTTLVKSGALAQYRIVHFATHALLDERNPELSGLILSLYNEHGEPQDGFLKLQDVYNLRFPADLVVLSACQTAVGRDMPGEGIISLTRGFIYSGAKRVLSTLWKVDDLATAELMKRFYAGMFGRHLDPATALQQAEISMWKQGPWQSPYYWAAFVLEGEWR